MPPSTEADGAEYGLLPVTQVPTALMAGAVDKPGRENRLAAMVSLSLLSLSLSCITRVAPHCVNTLMILHVAHSKFFTPEGGGRR